MAITQDYVSCTGIEGNDYKGASFTDGTFVNATLTLTKAGAFAATSVGHWLYLTDNGSGEVTAGYYRVTNVAGAPNSVVLHADIRSGVNNPTDVKCTQHAGTTALPWRSLQGAFDLLTRNAADGNQVNLKAGTAHVNDASLDLDEVIAGSALAAAAPLIIRGYTATANDGGIGEIDCGGATMFTATTYDYVQLRDLDCHTFGNNNGIALDTYCMATNVTVHKGASAPAGKNLFTLGPNSSAVGCYAYDGGTGGYKLISLGAGSMAFGNFVDGGASTSSLGLLYANTQSSVTNNIVVAGANCVGIMALGPCIIGNIVYSTVANTGNGIYAYAANITRVLNNIVVGWSGAGGDGVLVNENLGARGYNAFYNNTANYTLSDMVFMDDSANDVALAADPFTDAANGDFSLTAAAQAALADGGFPGQYLGAHANTDSHLNIGPIQLGVPDYPAEGDVESGVVYGSGAYTGDFTVPAVADVESGVGYGSAGVEFTGTFTEPGVGNVELGVTYGGGGVEFTGTFTEPGIGNVEAGVTYGAGGVEFTGTFAVPAVTDVQTGVTYGNAAEFTGTFDAPTVTDVEFGVGYGAGGIEFTGTFTEPGIGNVETGVTYGGGGVEFTGTFDVPAQGDVQSGVGYGAGGVEFTGTFTEPGIGNVESGVTYGAGGVEFTGTFVVPAQGDVEVGVGYGAGGVEFAGAFAVPVVGDVQFGVGYGNAGVEFTGTFTEPGIANVLAGVTYGAGGVEFTGTLAACDYPAVQDVQLGVAYNHGGSIGTFVAPGVGDVELGVGYGAAGVEFVGTFVVPAVGNVAVGVGYGAGGVEFVGTLFACDYPAVADVEAGVIYNWGVNVGTLVIPAEADVELGVGYGAGGVEFTGEMECTYSVLACPTDITDPVVACWEDWVWRRFTTKTITAQVRDPGGTPVDITGWDLVWSASPYLTKSTAAGTITVPAPTAGVFTFTITAAESLLFPYGAYAEATEHECKGETLGGNVYLLWHGRLRYTGTLITSI